MPLPNYSILGFNLSELRWSNFGARRLFESGWRWRRERVGEWSTNSSLVGGRKALGSRESGMREQETGRGNAERRRSE